MWMLLAMHFLAAAASPTAAEMAVNVSSADASFSVSVGSQAWLTSAPLRVFAEGEWQTPKLTGSRVYQGQDLSLVHTLRAHTSYIKNLDWSRSGDDGHGPRGWLCG